MWMHFFNRPWPREVFNTKTQNDFDNLINGRMAKNTFKHYTGIQLCDIFEIYEHKMRRVLYDPVSDKNIVRDFVFEKSICLNKKIDLENIYAMFDIDDLGLFNDIVRFVSSKYLGKKCTENNLNCMNEEVVCLMEKVGF